MKQNQDTQLSNFERAVLVWLCRGEKSLPAESMALTLLGVPHNAILNRNFYSEAPCNTAEFRTCYFLVATCLGANERLDKVKPLSRTWANVINNWDRLVTLYEEERFQDKQPKLDDLLFDLNHREVA